MTNTKTNVKSASQSKKDKEEIKQLKKTVSELTDLVQVLMKQNGSMSNNMINNYDRDVTFISLCSNILNLSTEPNGGGTVYTFNSFGEEQAIPYSDAKKIVKSNKNFIIGGKCYIADDELIASEHLTKDYKNILNKDSLLELLTSDRAKFTSVFDSMTLSQKEILKDIVVNKLMKNKSSVDMNIVYYINESLGVDIIKDVDYNKELLKVE